MSKGGQRSCLAEGCVNPAHARGMCKTHYSQWYRALDGPVPERPPRACSAPGCDRPYFANGWCEAHHARWRLGRLRLDVPLQTYRRIRTLADLQAYGRWVDPPAHRPEIGRCFVWPVRPTEPYGTASFHGKSWRVHRLAYTLAHGYIMPGLQVCHRCDNPACFRIEHLKLGTAAENQRDRWRVITSGSR